jgi:O-antigen/teichoic acid export membrane protein
VPRSLKKLASGDFVRHGMMVFGATAVMNGCNYLFHAVNSRHLGVVGYGELASLVAALTLLSFPAAAISLGVTKLAAEFHAVDDRAAIRRLFDLVMRWGIGIGVALIIVAFLTLPWSTRFLRIDDKLAVLLTVAAIAVNLLLPAIRAVLLGVEDFGAYARSVVIEGAGKVALGVGLPFAGFGVDGAVFGFLGGALLAGAYVAFCVRPHLSGTEPRLVVDGRRLLETASGVGLSSLAFAVLGFADVVAVKHFLDADQAGLYGALSLIGKIFLFAVGFIPQVVLPKVARRVAAGRGSGAYLVYSVATVGLVGAIGIAICAAMPSLVIRIVAGKAFVAVAPLVVPYAAAMTFLAMANAGATVRIGAHRMGFAVPMLAVTALELVSFGLFHNSLWDIVRTVLIGHLCVAAITLYGAVDRAASTQAVAAEAAA